MMNWTLRKRILAGFIAALLLTTALGAFCLNRMSVLNADAVMLGNNWMNKMEYMGTARAKRNRMRTVEMRLFVEGDEQALPHEEEEFARVRADNEEALKSIGPLLVTDEGKRLYRELNAAHQAYLNVHRQVIEHFAQKKVEEAKALLLGRSKEVYNKYEEVSDALTRNFDEGKDRAVAESIDTYSNTRALVVGVLVCLVALGLGGAVWLSNAISRPVVKAADAARQMARGALPERLTVTSSDETGRLTAAVNEMTDYLREMVSVAGRIAAGDLTAEVEPRCPEDQFGNALRKMVLGLRDSITQIGGGAHQVASASAQIAAASDQSKRASQSLASSSEEITATVHEMAASIRQVSQNAQTQSAAATETSAAVTQMVSSLHSIAEYTKQLAGLTAEASEAALAGQSSLSGADENMRRIYESVESAGQTIDRLGERAENIGRIVGTIDDIADQTNLLALNAAIEAARAGEHGLGFAVVADEVRKLAERSARSTKEISELIEAIQRESRAAVSRMKDSNATVQAYVTDTSVKDALGSIGLSVRRIVERTREIEAATAEQSSGAEQVARAAQDLSRLTQEISAATEEQSVGAAEIARAMEHLRGVVDQSVGMSGELQDSAEGLYKQSEVLGGVVRRFNTDGVRPAAPRTEEAAFGAAPLLPGHTSSLAVARVGAADLLN